MTVDGCSWSSSVSLSVQTNQVPFSQDMAIHRFFEGFFGSRSGVEAQLGVEGVDTEMIMMRAIRGTRPRITHIAFRVFSLLPIAGSCIAETFRNIGSGADVPGHPVRDAAGMRGIRIMDDDRYRFRVRRYTAQMEGGTFSGPITGVLGGNFPIVLKGRTGYVQRGYMRGDCHDQAD
jgi:hypothetical protein